MVNTIRSITPFYRNGQPATGAILVTLTRFLNPTISETLLGTTYLYLHNGFLVNNPIEKTPTDYILPDGEYYVKFIFDALENISCYGLCHNTHQWSLPNSETLDLYTNLYITNRQTHINETAASYKETIDELEESLTECEQTLSTLRDEIANSTTEEELVQCVIDLLDAQEQISQLQTENAELQTDLDECLLVLEEKMTIEEIQTIIDNTLNNCSINGQLPVGSVKLVEFESTDDKEARLQKESSINNQLADLSARLYSSGEKLFDTSTSNTDGQTSQVSNCKANSNTNNTYTQTDNSVVVSSEQSIRDTVRNILYSKLKSKKPTQSLQLNPVVTKEPTEALGSAISNIKKNCKNKTFPKQLILTEQGDPVIETPQPPDEDPVGIPEEDCGCDPTKPSFFVNPN